MKLILTPEDRTNLATDPGEMKNVQPEHPNVVIRFTSTLEKTLLIRLRDNSLREPLFEYPFSGVLL